MKAHPYRVFTEYFYRWSGVNSKFTFHTHPQYEIYYFHGGNCSYMLGDRIIALEPGDLIIMNGMTQHCPKVQEKSEYVRTMFSFDSYLLQIYGSDMLSCNPLEPFKVLRNHHIRLSADARAECEDLLDRINRFYRKDDIVMYNRFLIAFYDLLMFIYEQCRPAMAEQEQNVSERERYVQQLISYIEDRYTEDIQLDNMATKLHMSRYHMMKIFRKVTGLTVFDYVYRRRINQAKILFLYKKENTVTDVCFQVGFKHLSHFSRLFKKQVGVTPDRYRKLVHELGNPLQLSV